MRGSTVNDEVSENRRLLKKEARTEMIKESLGKLLSWVNQLRPNLEVTGKLVKGCGGVLRKTFKVEGGNIR